MDKDGELKLELVQQADYRFAVHFPSPSIAPLVTDEEVPVGAGAGPSPTQLLGAAVANCLAASLLFALRKFHNDPRSLRAEVAVRLARNEQRRLRVGGIGVDLHLGLARAEVKMLERILEQFEDFCVVTQSVRAAVPVQVRVIDEAGQILKPAS
jgi:organic hydroperoxide reductase OsmC/OhrA